MIFVAHQYMHTCSSRRHLSLMSPIHLLLLIQKLEKVSSDLNTRIAACLPDYRYLPHASTGLFSVTGNSFPAVMMTRVKRTCIYNNISVTIIS